MIGPGNADLLAAIRGTGSIVAAGRSMGMRYKCTLEAHSERRADAG